MNASVNAQPQPARTGRPRTRPVAATTSHAPHAHQAKVAKLQPLTSNRLPSQLASALLQTVWTHATPSMEDFSLRTLLERLAHLAKAMPVKVVKVAKKAKALELLRSLLLDLPSLLLFSSETFGPNRPAECPLVLRTDSFLSPCTCHETTS